ncbi:S41 family peptidase [Siphonobacter sp. SORGH_AS_1065]|uniref:S41 family peptidase n=1 Tax=Siphonobacter sp. SORGH_AS_1065 TaxID=3041795 RepID=UPI00277D549B|nr:S41 family peptidase [Siphonobacter sp. SORGH_AS_1065]MDQ1090489.1 hypothetical protein [Siphonobacter sp. SORGH_AS_1065]
MNKYLIILIILGFSKIATAQKVEKLTPHEIYEDIDSLVSYLEKIHPDPYGKYSKLEFYNDLNQLKNKIKIDYTIRDFYIKIAPLLTKLMDGHIDLKIKNYYNKNNSLVFPYVFKLSTKKPYIIYLKNQSKFNNPLHDNTEILSINEIPSKKIVQDIINIITGENKEFRAEFGAKDLHMYLDLLYGFKYKYKFSYVWNGKKYSTQLLSVDKNEIGILQKKPSLEKQFKNYTLSLQSDNIGIIDIKSFEWNNAKSFIDSTFKIIKEKNIQNVIINLIDNTGGDSDVGDEFLKYILDIPFKQYDKVISKNSYYVKQRLINQLSGKVPTEEQINFLKKRNGSIDTFLLDKIDPIIENDYHYKGKIFVLVNKQTYSSAADFAQCIKYYNRGIIVGEETGGLIKSYGDIVTVKLPNSKLDLTVSSKLYYNVGAKDDSWEGVIPNIISTKNNALNKVLQIIKKSK